MYVWRRLRDTAGSFLVCLIFVVPLAGSPSIARGDVREVIAFSWLFQGIPLALLVGLVIGARSVGTEIRAGAGDFIMTRPRSRKYFVWTGWGVGVVEIFVILAIAALCRTGALYSQHGPFWRQLPAATDDIPVLLASVGVFGLTVYSTSYVASIWTRRTGLAAGIALAFCLAYQTVFYWVDWANAHLPTLLVVPYKGMGGEYARATAIHELIAWVVCSFLFVLLGQIVFERSEI